MNKRHYFQIVHRIYMSISRHSLVILSLYFSLLFIYVPTHLRSCVCACARTRMCVCLNSTVVALSTFWSQHTRCNYLSYSHYFRQSCIFFPPKLILYIPWIVSIHATWLLLWSLSVFKPSLALRKKLRETYTHTHTCTYWQVKSDLNDWDRWPILHISIRRMLTLARSSPIQY